MIAERLREARASPLLKRVERKKQIEKDLKKVLDKARKRW